MYRDSLQEKPGLEKQAAETGDSSGFESNTQERRSGRLYCDSLQEKVGLLEKQAAETGDSSGFESNTKLCLARLQCQYRKCGTTHCGSIAGFDRSAASLRSEARRLICEWETFQMMFFCWSVEDGLYAEEQRSGLLRCSYSVEHQYVVMCCIVDDGNAMTTC